MSLTVEEDRCTRANGKIVICVRADNPEEACSSAAKQLAVDTAVKAGYARVGFNGQSGAVPVDDEGNDCDSDEKYAALTEKLRAGVKAITGYRNLITLMSSN